MTAIAYLSDPFITFLGILFLLLFWGNAFLGILSFRYRALFTFCLNLILAVVSYLTMELVPGISLVRNRKFISYPLLDYFDWISIWKIGLFGIILVVVTVLAGYFLLKKNSRNITPRSIEESIDNVPLGICVFLPEGMIHLTNKQMIQLCLTLTGEPLRNGKVFWEQLVKGKVKDDCIHLDTIENPAYQLPDVRAFEFLRHEVEDDGVSFVEVLANDYTDEYLEHEKLRESMARLQVVNARLKKISRTTAETSIQNEILQTKVAIHDELGYTLLAIRRFLETGEGNP